MTDGAAATHRLQYFLYEYRGKKVFRSQDDDREDDEYHKVDIKVAARRNFDHILFEETLLNGASTGPMGTVTFRVSGGGDNDFNAPMADD